MTTPSRFLSSARVIAGLTLLSRLLGLLREWSFSYFFGTGEVLSVFRIAFQVPNLTRRLFGEGALSSALIPVLTRTLKDEGEISSRRLVGAVLLSLALILGTVVIVAEIVILGWWAFSDGKALAMTAVLLPYALLICAVAVIGGVLNVRGQFAVPAALPCILNVFIVLGVIAGAVWVGKDELTTTWIVCAAVLIAGVVQLLISLAALRRQSFFPVFGDWWSNPKLRQVISLMGPMALGLSAVQINTLADNLIAYQFVKVDGDRSGPAILAFAHFLYQLPLGIFGIAIATAIFPVLTMCASNNDHKGLADAFERGVRSSLFIAIPASVGLAFVAHPLIVALYQHGKFNAVSSQRCATALTFYSLGLAAYFVQHVVVRTFYALHESRTPARIALWMVGVNLAMNLVLVQWMDESGLALATAICAFLQVGLLLVRFRRMVTEVRWGKIGGSLLRTAACAGVMAGVLTMTVVYAPVVSLLAASNGLRVAVMVSVGALSYALCARMLGQRELDELLAIRIRTKQNQGLQ